MIDRTDIERNMNKVQAVKQTGKLDYLELPATGGTLDSVKAFYSAAFGWTFTDYGPTYSAFDEGLHGGFHTDAVEGSAKPLPILYSEDLEATLAGVEIGRRQGREADLLLSGRQAFSFPRSRGQRARGLGRMTLPLRHSRACPENRTAERASRCCGLGPDSRSTANSRDKPENDGIEASPVNPRS